MSTTEIIREPKIKSADYLYLIIMKDKRSTSHRNEFKNIYFDNIEIIGINNGYSWPKALIEKLFCNEDSYSHREMLKFLYSKF